MQTQRKIQAYRRTNGVASFTVLTILLFSTGVFVMAVSRQSGSARRTVAREVAAQQAGMLASSAISEALAHFDGLVEPETDGYDMRAWLLSQAQNGVVASAQILGVEALRFHPRGTLDIIASERLPVSLSEVQLTPMSFRTMQNSGEVEMACTATYHLPTGQEVRRRVMSVHTISLDTDLQSFGVNEVPLQQRVDRGED
jgi:hypothetical protein